MNNPGVQKGDARLLWLLPPLVCLVYAGSLDNGFHFDDAHSIVENYHIRSLGNIPSFFVDPQNFSRDPAVGMYRPLLLVSYALNYAVGEYGGWGYHLVNLVLHGLAALLVGRLLAGLTASVPAGWWGGLFFAVHPIHSQAVNYISSRSELLSMLAVLAAFYWVMVRRRKTVWGLGAYALGLLSKASAVALLPLLVFYEWMRPAAERRWRRLWPFAILTLAYVGLIAANGFLSGSLERPVRTLEVQMYTQLKALVYYAELAAMPVHLSIGHSFRLGHSWSEGGVVLSGLFLLSLLYVGWRGLARRSWGSQALVWLGAGLGLTFFFPLKLLINEHRFYLPSVGVLLAVAGPLSARRLPALWGWIAALMLSVLAWQRSEVWQDEYSLWRDAASKTGDVFWVQSKLGEAHYARGEYDQAAERFERALALNPQHATSWNNLGAAREELGQFEEAERAYGRALKLRPDFAAVYKNLGRLKLKEGRYAQAEAQLLRALEIDPHYAQVRVNLGLIRQRRGRLEDAARQFEAALELEPRHRAARTDLGNVYYQMGERASRREDARRARSYYMKAASEYEQVLRLDPRYREALNNLGSAYRVLGREEEALQLLRRALEADPGFAEGYFNLAGIEQGRQHDKEAIALYERGLELKPDAAIYYELGNALVGQHNLAAAARAYRSACALDSTRVHYLYNLAEVLLGLGEGQRRAGAAGGGEKMWLEARRLFARVAAIEPGFGRVRERLRQLDESLK